MSMTIEQQYDWAKANFEELDKMNSDELDLSGLDIQVDVSNIDELPNEKYAILRKNGLGCSDSSTLVGVNPYNSFQDLVAEKSRDFLTDEERAVGNKSAVRKGRELEPFVIQKNSQITGRRIIKPVHMYRHKTYPFLTVNFDGVMLAKEIEGHMTYIPDEIKIVTYFGGKHYDINKAYFTEMKGYNPLPDPAIAVSNNTIETKAAMYGIPAYYYTQVQMEMFHLNAPFGYLTALFEKDWILRTWFIWKDESTQNKVLLQASKAWDKIAAAKNLEFDDKGLIKGIGLTKGHEEALKEKQAENVEIPIFDEAEA